MLVTSPTQRATCVGHQPQSLKTLKINYVHLHHDKENDQDEFAIAVYHNEFVVGHMPFYLSKSVCKFLTIPNSKLRCRVIEKRVNRLWSMVWRFLSLIFFLD